MTLTQLGWACTALCTAACSAPIDTTTVDGQVGAVSFAHPSAIYGRDDTSGLYAGRIYILLSESSSACGSLTATGLLSRSGVGKPLTGERIASLYLSQQDPSNAFSMSSTVGNGLVADLDPGGRRLALGDPSPLVYAKVGGLQLERFDDLDANDARATGAFNVNFPGGGSYSGTFSATPCKSLSPGCSTSGTGLTALGLLGLAHALFTRRRRVTSSSSSTGRAS